MLKKIFMGIAALVVAYIFLILYSTAKKCIAEELKATAAEEELNSPDVVLVKNSKAACEAEVAGMLNSRRIGYQEIKLIYRLLLFVHKTACENRQQKNLYLIVGN